MIWIVVNDDNAIRIAFRSYESALGYVKLAMENNDPDYPTWMGAEDYIEDCPLFD